MKDTAKNASGELFEIWRRDGRWYAQQITGIGKSWLKIAALLNAPSRSALLTSLAAHR